MVADALAKVGAAGEGIKVYEGVADLPRLARGQLRLDRLGIPQLRRIGR